MPIGAFAGGRLRSGHGSCSAAPRNQRNEGGVTWETALVSSSSTAKSVATTVYLHWHGDAVPGWLAQLKELMKGRYDDAFYAAARFVGICHVNIPGNLGLGITANGLSLAGVRDEVRLTALTPAMPGWSSSTPAISVGKPTAAISTSIASI